MRIQDMSQEEFAIFYRAYRAAHPKKRKSKTIAQRRAERLRDQNR